MTAQANACISEWQKRRGRSRCPASYYYRLVLGNTDSIELQFDGERVDLAPHSIQGVARLELGAIGGTTTATE